MHKKVVLITGVSAGIGHDLSLKLIQQGYQVIGLSRRFINIEGMTHYQCDISSIECVQKVIQSIKEEYTKIDYLINNAGIGVAGSLKDISYANIQAIIDTNIIGTITITKELLPLIIKAQGRIINIGSVAGDLTIPYQGLYSMSKAAIDKFSEALAMELKIYHIKVTNIMPGDTKTEFTQSRIINTSNDIEGQHAIKAIKKMEKDEQTGVAPSKVSNTIIKIMKKKNPPLRVTVGMPYKILIFLQRILPRKLIIYFINKLYS